MTYMCLSSRRYYDRFVILWICGVRNDGEMRGGRGKRRMEVKKEGKEDYG